MTLTNNQFILILLSILFFIIVFLLIHIFRKKHSTLKLPFPKLYQNYSFNNYSFKTNFKPSIIAVIKEQGISDSLALFFEKSGYSFTGVTNKKDLLNKLEAKNYDILLVDCSIIKINSALFLEQIRKINAHLYILLLTDPKDSIISYQKIKDLDIQGYCEKWKDFNQLLLLIESGIQSVVQKNEIKQINSQLFDTYEQLEKSYIESIKTLRYIVEAKDTYTRGHSDRVSAISVLIGKELKLSNEDLRKLEIGGLFHDIGKIGISDTILQKDGKLTESEYTEIKKHPNIGANILSSSSIFKDIIPIVKYHHERYDGKGYPEQLSGNKIPYLARITAIADSFDAMTSKRSYKKSLSIEYAISEFERCKGTQFDPKIAELFISLLKNEPNKIKEIQQRHSV